MLGKLFNHRLVLKGAVDNQVLKDESTFSIRGILLMGSRISEKKFTIKDE